MIFSLRKPRCGPIGIDIGTQSLKLVQLDGARRQIVDIARHEFNAADSEQRERQLVDALRRTRETHGFRGRTAVVCLSGEQLFVQNIRVPQATGDELKRIVANEAANRAGFGGDEAEVRFVEAGDVRQGEVFRREVILLTAPRTAVQKLTQLTEEAGLETAAVDVEPGALLRGHLAQFRRDDDQQRRTMIVNVGASTTKVIIAQGASPLFVKYVEIGGKQLDESVSKHFRVSLTEAASLRRNSGDRRADQRDPEVARTLLEAVRPILDRLGNELAMCLRYFSVTFRGQPVEQIVFGGGEASEQLTDWLQPRLDIACQLSQPLRAFERCPTLGPRTGQWDVAVGLALREVN